MSAEIGRSRKPVVLLAALLWLFAISFIDLKLSVDVSLIPFYWPAIGLTAWYCGTSWGYGVSLFAVGLAVQEDRIWGPIEFLSASFLWENAARLLSFVIMVKVVSRLRALERREAESRRMAQQAERLKSSMMSLMSHEIANSISILKMAAFQLREDEKGSVPPRRKECYDIIDRTLLNMNQEARNFLDNARLESGRLSLQLESVELRGLLDDLLLSFKPSFAQHGLTAVVNAPPGETSVRADRAALSLILSNLIGNAVKYTPGGGRVEVKVEESNARRSTVRISVADTGIGLSAEDVDKLGAFVRLRRGQSMADGFGLGLKTASDLLKLHGSALQIESKVGEGSCFSFTLPAAAARDDSAPSPGPA